MITKALKEWALAIKALEAGEQVLLLRKGGLVEGSGRFVLEAERFILYPTHYHQEPNIVRPGFEHLIQASISERPADGFLRIGLFADVAEIIPVTDRGAVQAVEKYHIWSSDYMEDRFDWKPESPLFLLLLRVYRFARVHDLALAPSYGGCTSWVDLNEPLSVEGSVPVLNDSSFQMQVDLIHRSLAAEACPSSQMI